MADINGTAVGTVTSFTTGDSGIVLMEINQVKESSQVKDKNSKGAQKGKGKDKTTRKIWQR